MGITQLTLCTGRDILAVLQTTYARMGMATRTTAEQRRKWYWANRERALAQGARHRVKYPGQATERMTKWREENPAKAAAIKRKWLDSGGGTAARARRRAAQSSATPLWADRHQMKLMYSISKRVTKETGVPHHVDHIIPLSHKLVCGLHCEFNLQLLTGSENDSKGGKYNV